MSLLRVATSPVSTVVMSQLFTEARTHNGFTDQPVTDDTLRRVYDLAKMGPTAVNCQPARFVFLRTQGAKDRLRPTLMEGNVAKTMKAPVVVIVAADTQFYDHLPTLFTAFDARGMYVANPAMADDTAARNTHLQAGYFIMAARAMGLSCGPMSGFDRAAVDKAFFPDGRWKSDMLINLGYGDAAAVYPRGPRLDFDVAAQLL